MVIDPDPVPIYRDHSLNRLAHLPFMYLIFFGLLNNVNYLSLKLLIMRTAALAFLFVAFGNAARAQGLSLLPQVGFENSFTKIQINDGSSFRPDCGKFSPGVSLHLNYASKKGHGFFVGAATSQSITEFKFTDPETSLTNYTASAGDMQVRLEGGYRFSSKPIFFSKPSSASTSSTKSSSKSGCHRSYSCKKKSGEQQAGKGSWMKVQPSLGMAYIPGVPSNLIESNVNGISGYEYRAGNWNTAVLAGAGVEFGKDNRSLFTISINYFQGLNNMGNETLTTQSTGKTVITNYASSASGWNLRVGIPFSLTEKKQVKSAAISSEAAKPKQQPAKQRCGQYKPTYRCGSKIM